MPPKKKHPERRRVPPPKKPKKNNQWPGDAVLSTVLNLEVATLAVGLRSSGVQMLGMGWLVVRRRNGALSMVILSSSESSDDKISIHALYSGSGGLRCFLWMIWLVVSVV